MALNVVTVDTGSHPDPAPPAAAGGAGTLLKAEAAPTSPGQGGLHNGGLLGLLPGAATAFPALHAGDPGANLAQCLQGRIDMYRTFQGWALHNYGDSGKTKTVTRRKYERILAILTGDEPATADNSKFRFWVKGKGFRLGLPPGEGEGLGAPPACSPHTLYVPARDKVGHCPAHLLLVRHSDWEAVGQPPSHTALLLALWPHNEVAGDGQGAKSQVQVRGQYVSRHIGQCAYVICIVEIYGNVCRSFLTLVVVFFFSQKQRPRKDSFPRCYN